MARRVALILAGGSGERFWPLSTPSRPKQLLRLHDPNHSLLEEAVARIEGLFDEIFIAATPQVAEPIKALGLIPPERVFVEPEPRNTLGALCWAAGQLQNLGFEGDTGIAVLASDHAIEGTALFRKTLEEALALADSSRGLVTIGIRPSRPETGYGYLEVGDESKVLRFVEKPDAETAAAYVESGRFLWNSGMFFWRLDAFISELSIHVPEAASVVADPSLFAGLNSASVDKALMERSQNIYVVPGLFRWDDLGSWDSLGRSLAATSEGNIEVGEVTAIGAGNCIVYSEGIPVGVIGVRDLVVVATANGVLVCPKSEAQRVREIAAELNRKKG